MIIEHIIEHVDCRTLSVNRGTGGILIESQDDKLSFTFEEANDVAWLIDRLNRIHSDLVDEEHARMRGEAYVRGSVESRNSGGGEE